MHVFILRKDEIKLVPNLIVSLTQECPLGNHGKMQTSIKMYCNTQQRSELWEELIRMSIMSQLFANICLLSTFILWLLHGRNSSDIGTFDNWRAYYSVISFFIYVSLSFMNLALSFLYIYLLKIICLLITDSPVKVTQDAGLINVYCSSCVINCQVI